MVRSISRRCSPSLMTEDCNTRYAPDYYVRNPADPDAQRVYYLDPPPIIGISEHSFVDRQLCNLISQQYLWSQCVSNMLSEGLRSSSSNRASSDHGQAGCNTCGAIRSRRVRNLGAAAIWLYRFLLAPSLAIAAPNPHPALESRFRHICEELLS